MTITKTFRGKSANKILSAAKVAETVAGTFEIISEELPAGYIIVEAEFDAIAIECAAGEVACLEMSPRAIEKFRELRHQRGRAYYAAA